MLIRDATPADLDLMCRMRLAFLAEHRGLDVADLPADLPSRTRDFIERRQQAGSILGWLAQDDDGRRTGTVSMLLLDMAPMPDDQRSSDGYVINMFVEPEHRGHGIGRALLDACVAGARRAGVRRLLLFATDDGRPLYRSAGFAPDDDWMDLRLDP